MFTNPQAGRSGSFLVSATASDPLSGLVKVTFPALAGFGAGGGDVASPGPYQTTYSWSGAGATASGAQTVHGDGRTPVPDADGRVHGHP